MWIGSIFFILVLRAVLILEGWDFGDNDKSSVVSRGCAFLKTSFGDTVCYGIISLFCGP